MDRPLSLLASLLGSPSRDVVLTTAKGELLKLRVRMLSLSERVGFVDFMNTPGRAEGEDKAELIRLAVTDTAGNRFYGDESAAEADRKEIASMGYIFQGSILSAALDLNGFASRTRGEEGEPEKKPGSSPSISSSVGASATEA